jgi:transposase-like protein
MFVKQNNLEPLEGVVEVDETFIGGKEGNKHFDKKTSRILGAVGSKVAVVGAIKRGGEVVTKVIKDTTGETLGNFVKSNVLIKSWLMTDENYSYRKLGKIYTHDRVHHTVREYVRGIVHTNTIENFWSVVKRCIHGTYHQLSEKHLQTYMNEFCYRHVNRKETPQVIMDKALSNCKGRLRWKDLVVKSA